MCLAGFRYYLTIYVRCGTRGVVLEEGGSLEGAYPSKWNAPIPTGEYQS